MCDDHDVPVSTAAQHTNTSILNKILAFIHPNDTLLFASVPAIIKVHGAHLKASAAMVRLRLYDILALLPPKTYEGNTRPRCLVSRDSQVFCGLSFKKHIFSFFRQLQCSPEGAGGRVHLDGQLGQHHHLPAALSLSL